MNDIDTEKLRKLAEELADFATQMEVDILIGINQLEAAQELLLYLLEIRIRDNSLDPLQIPRYYGDLQLGQEEIQSMKQKLFPA